MDAGRSTKSVAAENRIVVGNVPTASLRRGPTILAQPRQIILDPAHQFQVHQQLIHRRVAHPLANAKRGAVDLIGAALDGSYRINHAEAAILVAVPVKTDVAALFLDDVFDKADHRTRAVRGGMSDGIADADRLRAAMDGRRESARIVSGCSRA